MNILNNWKMLELVTRDGEALLQLNGNHDQARLGVSVGQARPVTGLCTTAFDEAFFPTAPNLSAKF